MRQPTQAKGQRDRKNKSRRSFLVLKATLKWVTFPYSSERFNTRSLLLHVLSSSTSEVLRIFHHEPSAN